MVVYTRELSVEGIKNGQVLDKISSSANKTDGFYVRCERKWEVKNDSKVDEL